MRLLNVSYISPAEISNTTSRYGSLAKNSLYLPFISLADYGISIPYCSDIILFNSVFISEYDLSHEQQIITIKNTHNTGFKQFANLCMALPAPFLKNTGAITAKAR